MLGNGLSNKIINLLIESSIGVRLRRSLITRIKNMNIMKRGNRVRKNNISLCVIIKNEEESIERCLNSIKELIGEIIIDTGSSNHTIDICKQYSKKF